ncbi:MAG: site-specific DNA-methyltransferase [Actinobacteria bacterium]|nr:site-specific DNA-methyltransferase [Actinomycetota bacterium]
MSTEASADRRGRDRGPTSTANFGSGRREGHDATAFYDRFVAPEISTDTTLHPPGLVDVVHRHDARDMSMVPSGSVALVVTSPPYFAGKQYEEELGVGGVPADYLEYLDLLRAVFAECKRVLEPGGRIAVNVANLGRRPYRSLSGDVTAILQDLGLLLRGEVIWVKGRAAGGSCAWGSFQQPTNPVLRDVTERIVVAGKGRFDRALTARQRAERDLPSVATITRDEFMEATTDVWEIPPERATRVGHPAPFPVELPLRLIDLYTYRGDVVLDPFMGSGSTAVAAVRSGRSFVGFDLDADYVAIAQRRVQEERDRVAHAVPTVGSDAVAAMVAAGRQAVDVAATLVADCGFTDLRRGVSPRGLGISLSIVAIDADGREWAFDVSGGLTVTRSGLRRADVLWRAIGAAAVLHGSGSAMPLVLISTDLPARGTAGEKALRMVTGAGRPVFDVVELLDDAGRDRLRRHAAGGVATSTVA